MVLITHSVKETHYDILSIQENASYEEIRSRYRTLILNHHPDKLNAGSTQPIGDSFLKIQKAWEVLSDAKSRRLYNNELQASRQEMTASEDIHLDDMMIDDDEEVNYIYYPCRCGDSFSVDSNELEEKGYPLIRNGVETRLKLPAGSTTFIIPCGSCSLKIRLLLDSDAIFRTI